MDPLPPRALSFAFVGFIVFLDSVYFPLCSTLSLLVLLRKYKLFLVKSNGFLTKYKLLVPPCPPLPPRFHLAIPACKRQNAAHRFLYIGKSRRKCVTGNRKIMKGTESSIFLFLMFFHVCCQIVGDLIIFSAEIYIFYILS